MKLTAQNSTEKRETVADYSTFVSSSIFISGLIIGLSQHTHKDMKSLRCVQNVCNKMFHLYKEPFPGKTNQTTNHNHTHTHTKHWENSRHTG